MMYLRLHVDVFRKAKEDAKRRPPDVLFPASDGHPGCSGGFLLIV
jgi:hypothetical protein